MICAVEEKHSWCMLVNIVEKYFIESQVSQFLRVCLCIGGASSQGWQFSVGASAAQCLVPVAVCNIPGLQLRAATCSLATPLAWVTRQGVDGCVLVSTYVHRASAILHASRSVAHYM